jgi:hypothetical protein
MYYFFSAKERKIKITLVNLRGWFIVWDYEPTTTSNLLFHPHYVGS